EVEVVARLGDPARPDSLPAGGRCREVPAEGTGLRTDTGTGRFDVDRLRRGVALIELRGILRVGRSVVAPRVGVAIDLDRARHLREVVVVDQHVEHTSARVLDRVRRDGVSALEARLVDADGVAVRVV